MFLFRSALSIYEKFYLSLSYILGPDLIYPAPGEIMYLLHVLQFQSPPCLNDSVVYNNCHSTVHLIPGGGHVPHPAEEWSAELITTIQNRNSNVPLSDKTRSMITSSHYKEELLQVF